MWLSTQHTMNTVSPILSAYVTGVISKSTGERATGIKTASAVGNIAVTVMSMFHTLPVSRWLGGMPMKLAGSLQDHD